MAIENGGSITTSKSLCLCDADKDWWLTIFLTLAGSDGAADVPLMIVDDRDEVMEGVFLALRTEGL